MSFLPIDQDILRLKREVVRDDAKGHSCEKCEHITLRRIPEPNKGLGTDDQPSYLWDTTVAEIGSLAASRCNFWGTIWNQLELIDLEEIVQKEQEKVRFEVDKHGSWWSDDHYKDLAASLGGDLEKKFWQLRRSPVSWGFTLGTMPQMHFAVTREDFVRVIIKYTTLNDFEDANVSAEVVLNLPTRPFETAWPEGLGLTMRTYWTELWILSSPGKVNTSAYDLQ